MPEERLELIEEMRKKNPEDSFLAYAAALEYNKLGEKNEAISIIEALLKRDPQYLSAYYQLGRIYEETDQHKKAVSVYKEGKEIARKRHDQKAIGELSEALMLLDEEEGNW
ncbi:MAG TPA: hypothetical protein DDX92_13140 [Flavobacteriales bacterium]|jgi:predicted Zn-dependent protease|nr:hypothetical protein [Flavobacteriales bacterium]